MPVCFNNQLVDALAAAVIDDLCVFLLPVVLLFLHPGRSVNIRGNQKYVGSVFVENHDTAVFNFKIQSRAQPAFAGLSSHRYEYPQGNCKMCTTLIHINCHNDPK